MSGSSIDRAPKTVRNAIALTTHTARKSALTASCHHLLRWLFIRSPFLDLRSQRDLTLLLFGLFPVPELERPP